LGPLVSLLKILFLVCTFSSPTHKTNSDEHIAGEQIPGHFNGIVHVLRLFRRQADRTEHLPGDGRHPAVGLSRHVRIPGIRYFAGRGPVGQEWHPVQVVSVASAQHRGRDIGVNELPQLQQTKRLQGCSGSQTSHRNSSSNINRLDIEFFDTI